MKNFRYGVLFLAIVGIGLVSCKKEIDNILINNNKNSSNSYSEEIWDLGQQFGMEINAEIVNISYGININIETVQRAINPDQIDDWDIEAAVEIEFENTDGIILKTIVVPLKSNMYTMTCINVIEDEINFFVADFLFNEEDQTMSAQINETLNPFALKAAFGGGWTRCMRRFFNSDIGTVVQVAGVAATLGCFACGAVAGVYTGVAALGCTAATN